MSLDPAVEWYSAFRWLMAATNPQAAARKTRVANAPQNVILPHLAPAIPLSSRVLRAFRGTPAAIAV
jgi:hypothetical protein